MTSIDYVSASLLLLRLHPYTPFSFPLGELLPWGGDLWHGHRNHSPLSQYLVASDEKAYPESSTKTSLSVLIGAQTPPQIFVGLPPSAITQPCFVYSYLLQLQHRYPVPSFLFYFHYSLKLTLVHFGVQTSDWFSRSLSGEIYLSSTEKGTESRPKNLGTQATPLLPVRPELAPGVV